MDAFFVAVELRRRPELRGRPVVVGGTGRRGVVAAASYEARRYGVHSAMPSAIGPPAVPGGGVPARRPRRLRRGQPRGPRHLRRASRRSIEPLALDEAFLDVTGARALLGDGVTIARRLRADIARAARPDVLGRRGAEQVPGQAGVRRRQAAADARRRAARARRVRGPPGRGAGLPPPAAGRAGCGASGRRRSSGCAGWACRRSATSPRSTPVAVLGALGRAHGRHLLDLAAGRDDRPVEVERDVKSIGHEETFAHDLHDLADVRRELVRLADAVAARLRAARHGRADVHAEGARRRRSRPRRRATPSPAPSTRPRRSSPPSTRCSTTIDLAAGVRLLGLAASKFAAPAEQLRLDGLDGGPAGAGSARALERRQPGRSTACGERFGDAAIGPASSVAIGPDGRRRACASCAPAPSSGARSRRRPPAMAARRPRDGDDALAR